MDNKPIIEVYFDPSGAQGGKLVYYSARLRSDHRIHATGETAKKALENLLILAATLGCSGADNDYEVKLVAEEGEKTTSLPRGLVFEWFNSHGDFGGYGLVLPNRSRAFLITCKHRGKGPCDYAPSVGAIPAGVKPLKKWPSERVMDMIKAAAVAHNLTVIGP
jgi:hypothetical protein